MAQCETDDVAGERGAEAAGRTVVVTGGGGGIGRSVAGRFAAAGDRVLLVGRREHALREAAGVLRAAGGRVDVLACDLADPDRVEAALESLPPRIDVLVNAAGSRARRTGPGSRGVRDRWQQDFERNVLTVVLLTEAVRDRLTVGGGRVVTVTSLAALRGGGSYGAAKAALHAWNHSFAARLGPQGITCNVVAPGAVAGTGILGEPPDLDRRAARTLVRRVGRAADVAAAVLFLASPDAGFITGEILRCGGGELLGR